MTAARTLTVFLPFPQGSDISIVLKQGLHEVNLLDPRTARLVQACSAGRHVPVENRRTVKRAYNSGKK